MATILCVSDGMLSVVYPALELSRRLAADGHTVRFASSARHRPDAERLNLPFHPLPANAVETHRQAEAGTSWIRRLVTIRSRRQQFLAAMNIDTFARGLQSEEIDLVLIDGEMHEQIVVALGAARQGGPRVCLLNTFSSIWRCKGLPPPHTAVLPGVGLSGSRVGMTLLWWALRGRKALRRLRHWLRDVGCDRVSLLHVLARERKVDSRRELDAGQWLIPFTYRRTPVLSLHALAFEFPHSPPAHVRYVGPMISRSRVPPMDAADDRGRLERVLASPRKALVYAAFGSTLTASTDFLHRLVAACRDCEWTLVLSLGSSLDPTLLGQLPDNVHAFQWVPQLRVLEEATIAVTHGGINTLDECVLHAVPVLIYCGGETDMAGNSARVTYHGIGRVADPQDTSETIRKDIHWLLQDKASRERIAVLREHYLDAGALEESIHELLGTARSELLEGERRGHP